MTANDTEQTSISYLVQQ